MRGSGVAGGMATTTLTTENHDETVKDGTVLIDFWAGWCVPCQRFAPIFDKASEAHPDVVLLDIRMPVLDGVAAARRIAQRASGPRVLMLTTFNEDQLVREAVEAGASGFLLKDADPAELSRAIHEVARGGFVISSAAGGHLASAYRELVASRTAGAAPSSRARLTPREGQVLEHVARGRSNAEIACELCVSEETIKTHVSNLLAKLHCRDRVGLVVLALTGRRE